jgi:DnaK suppressor protein
MAQENKFTASEIVKQKANLKGKLAELLRGSSRTEDLQIENLADPLDQMQSALNREMAMNRLEVQADLLREVRTALHAIDDGSYGICSSCEEPIPVKRLNAVPWAARCVRCQTELESEEWRYVSPLSNAA